MKTLSAKFIERANATMKLAGMNIIAYKRDNQYGSGEDFNLIYDLEYDFERYDGEYHNLMNLCPLIIKENATQEIFFWEDGCPRSMETMTQEEITTYYKNLLKVQRLLRKMGI